MGEILIETEAAAKSTTERPAGLQFRWIVQLVLITTVIASGCGDSDEAAQVPVSGSVAFQGRPVGEGVVNFLSRTTGRGATATLNSTGEFTVENGMEPGEYVVSVMPPPTEEVAGAAAPAAVPKEYPDIPHKYRSDTTSDLTAVIGNEGTELTFELVP